MPTGKTGVSVGGRAPPSSFGPLKTWLQHRGMGHVGICAHAIEANAVTRKAPVNIVNEETLDRERLLPQSIFLLFYFPNFITRPALAFRALIQQSNYGPHRGPV